jgi:hypothetical protein
MTQMNKQRVEDLSIVSPGEFVTVNIETTRRVVVANKWIFVERVVVEPQTITKK